MRGGGSWIKLGSVQNLPEYGSDGKEFFHTEMSQVSGFFFNIFHFLEPCRDSKSSRYCLMIKKAGFCTSQRSLYYKDCLKTCGACRKLFIE